MTFSDILCVICFVGCLPAAAFADQAPDPSDKTAAAPGDVVESPHVMPGQTDPATGITAPESDGVHAADAFYPKLARRLREQGKIKLKFVVTPQGTVANLVVVDSSGFADLDAAAIEAVKTWRYKPARKDGVPIAVKLGAVVQFQIRDETGATVLVEMAPSDYPSDALAAKEEGQVGIVVTVGKDGRAVSAAIFKSSNSQRLDRASMAIVTGRWHFTPAMRDGEPVESQTIYVLNWRLPEGGTAEGAATLPPRP